MKIVDEKVVVCVGVMYILLMMVNVEKYFEDVGLDKEFGIYICMGVFFGG